MAGLLRKAGVMKFEKEFLIGAATAAHQVEGNNTNSDMWAMEHMKTGSFAEPSLDAVDQYNRYEEDIKLMEQAHLNAYRFSIEWARIEPEDGIFDEKEMRHYMDEIACCKAHGLEPIITLHHFSSPKWLITKGGWEAQTTPDDFEKYVRYVISRIGSEVKYICTINEANMGLQVASLAKSIMMKMTAKMRQGAAQAGPQDPAQSPEHSAQQSPVQSSAQGGSGMQGGSPDGKIQMGINLEQMIAARQAAGREENLAVFGVEKLEYFTSMRTPEGDRIIMRAHTQARNAIKELYPEIKVGLTLSLYDIQACEGGEAFAAKQWDEDFSHYLPYISEDDFLGVQNYTRSLMGPEGQLPNPEGAELTQMEYEFYPEALENVIRKVSKEFHGDIIVTENGIAAADDECRVEFIRRALAGVQNCINDKIPVKGYMYWSLIDNFEWQKGYSMTFGLIGVDRASQKRCPKESLKYLGSFAGK